MVLQHDKILDSLLQFKDAGLIAATAVTQVGGTDYTLDLGAAKFQKLAIVVDVSACEVASGDESYLIQVQGSDTSAFTNAYQLTTIRLGDTSATGDKYDTIAGTRKVAYTDNVAMASATDATAEIACRYIRVRTVVSGTIATGINYTGWFVKEA